MLPVGANQAQDTLGSATPHRHRTIDCRYPRLRSRMGTIFEPAFGGFPAMGSYGNKSFTSFGPPVDFEAGFGQPERWQNEKGYSNESCLSSETPGMQIRYYLEIAWLRMSSELSSRPSSRNSSRPSSYHSSSRASQRSSHDSLPDPESYAFGMNPRIADDYETVGKDPYVWSSYSIPEYSSWPADYTTVDHSSLPVYESPFPPPLPNVSPAQFSFSSLGTFQNAKLLTPTYSASYGQLFSYQSYPYPMTTGPELSNRSELRPDDSVSSAGCSPNLHGLCPYPNCGKVFKDLKAHLLTHSKVRPEKCPIITCEFHVRGFCRKYDKQRHTLTHFKGTLVCNFCPGRGTPAAKTFQRADVFKRHLVSVHGAENSQSPPSRKSSSPKSTIPCMESSECHWPGSYGNCSNCSVTFANVQPFYYHLDECVISSVLRQASNYSADAPLKRQVENFKAETDRAEKFGVSKTVHEVTKKGETMNKPEVINEGEEYRRKRRSDYPPSWGNPRDTMKMKKRVMCAFDGNRQLWKDETFFAADLQANIPWSRMESYAKDLDALRITQPEVYFNEEWFKADSKGLPFLDTHQGLFDYSIFRCVVPSLYITAC
jgi:hypothetical protein